MSVLEEICYTGNIVLNDFKAVRKFISLENETMFPIYFHKTLLKSNYRQLWLLCIWPKIFSVISFNQVSLCKIKSLKHAEAILLLIVQKKGKFSEKG